ncbi:hypothetical protein [Streptomyces sp. NEAU-YJ-81]|nr:hypothetical protein [Streptomyces sp. NEAU-YJ-81]
MRATAELIEEIERYCGSAEVQPLDERRSQVEEALFGSRSAAPLRKDL